MEKEILTIGEAAEFLQLSKRSLYKLAKGRVVPGRKILNRWRFEREALKRWLSEAEAGDERYKKA
jgi:excisionase family DNA binding protein